MKATEAIIYMFAAFWYLATTAAALALLAIAGLVLMGVIGLDCHQNGPIDKCRIRLVSE